VIDITGAHEENRSFATDTEKKWCRPASIFSSALQRLADHETPYLDDNGKWCLLELTDGSQYATNPQP